MLLVKINRYSYTLFSAMLSTTTKIDGLEGRLADVQRMIDALINKVPKPFKEKKKIRIKRKKS
jgi:hypothetical protein